MKAPPKRAIFIVLVVLLAAGLVTRGYWQPPLLGLLGIDGDDGRYLGYVEGETSLIAPPVAGQLLERPVDRGGHVKKGDRLFVIDPTVARSEVARAEAALAETKARHENLLTGKRPEEQDVIRAQRREAEASLSMAEIELKRQTELLPKGFTTRQAYDQAESQVNQLRARLASLAAQERVGDLSARQAEIAAAAALIVQNEANLAQARKRLADLMPVAPEDALVENTFFNVGEWVPAGTPVVSLLPAVAREAALLRARGGRLQGAHGPQGELHLRRLPAGSPGHHHLRLAARRVHAAGDLLAERPRPSWCS